MAEVSYLHLHENDDDEHDDNNNNKDLDDHFLCHADPNPSHNDHHSILFDRENQVNFVIDMFHQSVEQSQQSRVSFSRNHTDHANDDHDNSSGYVFSDCWDDFFISRATIANRSESDPVPIPNVNEDLEWDGIDEAYETEQHQQQPNALEWEVLLNTYNLESNPDYEMLFGQFLDNDSPSTGRPPASVTVVENLASVVISEEEDKGKVCAVCKDEMGSGLIAKQLPCDHVYHGDCIVPWLEIRNTCPVCRYELLTDDVDYERRKAAAATASDG